MSSLIAPSKLTAQINDLLGSGQFDTKKHEIKHDKEGKMSVTDAVSSKLMSASIVSCCIS